MDLREEKYRLNKDIPIPLYYQIKRMILNDLSSGKLKEGDPLPTETEFCVNLEISRPTVRQALNELVSEGVLIRKKKSGTFVAQPKIELPVHIDIESLKKGIESTGRECGIEVLDLCMLDAVEEVNMKLHLDNKENLIYLKRMWMTGQTPIAYTATYLSYDRFKQVLDGDFCSIMLPDFLKLHYNVEVDQRDTKVNATLASKFDLELLQINRTRAALLCIMDVGKSDGQPIYYSVTRYRGDQVSLEYVV